VPAPEGWYEVRLSHGPLGVRPLLPSDRRAWTDVRARNRWWLQEWEATLPPESPPGHPSYRSMMRELRRQVREGRCLPFAITVDGRFAGQVTVSNIVMGSAMFGQVGYWIDEEHAGHGHTPAAVAMVADYCFGPVNLHRLEIAVRPENTASLRVLEKLQVTEIGFAPRYLHIAGAWRDHRLFAVTREEVPGGLLRRFLSS
jgi:[ribosomal protein S5]-alanine N-acetyltransferase